MNRIKIINFKSISEMEIEPEGKSFILKGKNGAGKSAVIEAIEWALRGKKALPDGIMKAGEDYTEVVFENDEFIITRTWKAGKNPTLVVKDKEGKIYPSPQGMLDDIVTNLSFDPSSFLQMTDKQQVEAFRSLIDPDGKIAEIESERESAFSERTISGRDVRTAKGFYESLPQYDDAPETEVSSQDLLKDLNTAQEAHRNYDNKISSFKRMGDGLKACEDELYSLERKMDELQEKIDTREKQKDELKELIEKTDAELSTLKKDLPDLEPLRQAFIDADETNKKVRANLTKQNAAKNFEKATALHDSYTLDIKNFDKQISHLMSESELPIEGLGFSADGSQLVLHNMNLRLMSDGERLGIALKISMAMNKGLKIIAIKNGSLLDDERQKQIMQFAKEHGYQVIMEVVADVDIQVEIEMEVQE